MVFKFDQIKISVVHLVWCDIQSECWLVLKVDLLKDLQEASTFILYSQNDGIKQCTGLVYLHY